MWPSTVRANSDDNTRLVLTTSCLTFPPPVLSKMFHPLSPAFLISFKSLLPQAFTLLKKLIPHFALIFINLSLATIRRLTALIFLSVILSRFSSEIIKDAFGSTMSSLVIRTLARSIPQNGFIDQIVNETRYYDTLDAEMATCKRYFSCRAGQLIASEFPSMADWLTRSRLMDKLNDAADEYLRIAMTSFTASNDTCLLKYSGCRRAEFTISSSILAAHFDRTEL